MENKTAAVDATRLVVIMILAERASSQAGVIGGVAAIGSGGGTYMSMLSKGTALDAISIKSVFAARPVSASAFGKSETIMVGFSDYYVTPQ